jgi:lipoprotein-anchoring transpeptidase ErfK/SrfK
VAGSAAALTLGLSSGPGPPSAPSSRLDALADIPAPAAPAFQVGHPVPLPPGRGLTRWQASRSTATARAAPAAGAAAVGTLPARTPEGTANIVLPTAVARDGAGALWVRVVLPTLPRPTPGWVPRTALGASGVVATRLVVDRARLTATLLRHDRPVLTVPVGIGTPAAPTPAGRYVVRDRLVRYRSPFYGPVAFGTSARSPTLTDWPAGGYVGIHGTDRPDLIPGRISHGCVRLRNPDMRRLARRMPVGTPVVVR